MPRQEAEGVEAAASDESFRGIEGEGSGVFMGLQEAREGADRVLRGLWGGRETAALEKLCEAIGSFVVVRGPRQRKG